MWLLRRSLNVVQMANTNDELNPLELYSSPTMRFWTFSFRKTRLNHRD
jgi:hypothetical protein